MIRAIDHIGLCVRDLPHMVAFYQHAAGLRPQLPQLHPDPHNTHYNSQMLQGPRCTLELLGSARDGSPAYRSVHEAGITHFCLQTDQIAPMYQRFASAGATFHAPPVQLSTGNMYCYSRDPEQNVVELEALPNAPADQPPWFAHVAFATHNIERLASFYHQILGGTRAGGHEIGPNALYDTLTGLKDMRVIPAWIIGANITIEIWQFLNPVTQATQPERFDTPGYSHICFEVNDLRESLALLHTAGGFEPVLVEQPDQTQHGFIRDPDGNWLELKTQITER